MMIERRPEGRPPIVEHRFWNPQCMSCKRLYNGSGFKCGAYPNGIPEEIIQNKVSHKTPYGGDHGLMYVEKKYSASKAQDDVPADKSAPFEEAQYAIGREDADAAL